MAIRTLKEGGGGIRVTKDSSLYREAQVTAAWQRRQDDGSQFDVDLSVALTDINGHCIHESDLVYWNPQSLTHPSGAVHHHGDDLEGSEDGETPSEMIDLRLVDLPASIEQVHIYLDIYRARQRRQSFGSITKGSLELVGSDETVRIDLTDLNPDMAHAQIGVLERDGDAWSYAADLRYFESFEDVVTDLGLEVGQ